MQVTSVGHAGFRIDTKAGSILCDPWVNPAYFASWFPFPDNSTLDWDALGDVDYLYVSHLHTDHFDPKTPARARQQGRRRAAARLSGARPATRTREARLSPVLRDDGLRQTPRQRAQGRSRRDDHRACAPRPTARSATPVWWSPTARRCAFNMNDARPVDLDVLARRFRPRRRAHAAVLGRDLVPDGLRHARPREGGVRHPEASAPDGPLPPVHRAGRRDVGGAVGRPAVLPRPRAA